MSAAALLGRQFQQVHALLEAGGGHAPGSAAYYARAVLCDDVCVNGVLAARWPLALTTWARRTGLSPLPDLGAPIDWRAWTRTVQLDLDGLRLYAAAVYKATDAYLAALPDAPAITTVRVLTGLLLTLSMLHGEILGLDRRVPTPSPVSPGEAPRAYSPISEEPTMEFPQVVTREEWLVARKELLAREKAAPERRTS